MPAINELPPLMRPQEVADFLGVSFATLTVWRCKSRRRGPAFVKMGRQVRYRREDVARFAESLPRVEITAAEG